MIGLLLCLGKAQTGKKEGREREGGKEKEGMKESRGEGENSRFKTLSLLK